MPWIQAHQKFLYYFFIYMLVVIVRPFQLTRYFDGLSWYKSSIKCDSYMNINYYVFNLTTFWNHYCQLLFHFLIFFVCLRLFNSLIWAGFIQGQILALLVGEEAKELSVRGRKILELIIQLLDILATNTRQLLRVLSESLCKIQVSEVGNQLSFIYQNQKGVM